jgi:hypothetical protein
MKSLKWKVAKADAREVGDSLSVEVMSYNRVYVEHEPQRQTLFIATCTHFINDNAVLQSYAFSLSSEKAKDKARIVIGMKLLAMTNFEYDQHVAKAIKKAIEWETEKPQAFPFAA